MFGFIRRHAFALAALAGGFAAAGYAIAQQGSGGYPIPSPLGTEQIEVYAGASPLINTVTVDQIRNTAGAQLVGVTSGALNLTTHVGNLLINGQPSAPLTITLPASPVPDGQIVTILNSTGSAFATQAITVQAASGQTLSAAASGTTLTTLASHASVEYHYALSTNTWYQLR